jgi:hypothetical protein
MHMAQAPGGCSPGGASPARPGSTTTATRLRPSSAGVSAHTVAKSAASPGAWWPWTPVTENRHPSTVPSAGLRKAGPTLAKDHPASVPSQ